LPYQVVPFGHAAQGNPSESRKTTGRCPKPSEPESESEPGSESVSGSESSLDDRAGTPAMARLQAPL
jgi:hypothetical protein